MKSPVRAKIKEAASVYPLHMPGHKRNPAFMPLLSCAADITELSGFDDLHRPTGVLRESMDFAARLFAARQSFYLVNGSTCGILSAIAAVCPHGGKLLLARNCHISAYHAAELLDLELVTAEPDWLGDWGIYGSLSARTLADALDAHADIALVVIVSPTYEGITSDIPALAALCHARGIPLLVDAAHGAHLGFCAAFPQSAVEGGADIVVQSLHKTLPAPTQCAILHLCTERVSAESIAHALRIFQSSSPSYMLVSAMDDCLRRMAEEGAALLMAHAKRLDRFYQKAETLTNLRILPASPSRDKSKIWVSTRATNITGETLCSFLHENGFALEMHNRGGALALTSLCDTDEALERFADLLLSIDAKLHASPCPAPLPCPPLGTQVCKIFAALAAAGENISLKQAAMRVAREYIYAYPPGIPLVLPGQLLTEPMLSALCALDASFDADRWISVL